MLDFSFSEFMVVVVVAVLAVGPKQLPEVLYGLGKVFRRMQHMRYALTRQFDDFMDQAELKDLRNPARLIDIRATAADITDEGAHDAPQMMEKISPTPVAPSVDDKPADS